MKFGIVSLLQAGKKVVHATNGEKWNWILWSFKEDQDYELAIEFVPSSSQKDAMLKNTTVTVYGVTANDLKTENFLFLSPPSANTTYRTDYGSILLDDHYSRKIFDQGIFITRHAPGRCRLQYGLDFDSNGQVDLGRDRAHIPNGNETALAIYNIWEDAIKKYPNNAVFRYLTLLLDHEMAFDVLDAEALITKPLATTLLAALRTKTEAQSFYCSPDNNDLTVLPKLSNL